MQSALAPLVLHGLVDPVSQLHKCDPREYEEVRDQARHVECHERTCSLTIVEVSERKPVKRKRCSVQEAGPEYPDISHVSSLRITDWLGACFNDVLHFSIKKDASSLF